MTKSNEDVQEMLKRIAQLEADYQEARRVYYATADPLKKAVAEQLCPYEVNDLVVDEHGVESVITRIEFDGSVARPSFSLFGRKVLKSRALHQRESRFFSWFNNYGLTKVGTYTHPS